MRHAGLAFLAGLLVGCSGALMAGWGVCESTIWGDTVCTDTETRERFSVREDIWGDTEIRQGNRVLYRCKDTIWGDLECQETGESDD